MGEKVLDQNGNHELDKKNAVDFVETCVNVDENELKGILSSYIKYLWQAIRHNTVECLDGFINTVYKGLRFKSERAGAIKYFYFGYYARYQEEVLNEAQKYDVHVKINQIASKKHFERIMRYLYINGISQQKDIASELQIDKSNLSRILDEVADFKLASKLIGPKNVFYELTQEGYAYCRKYKWCADIFGVVDFWADDTGITWDLKVSYKELTANMDDGPDNKRFTQNHPPLREYEDVVKVFEKPIREDRKHEKFQKDYYRPSFYKELFDSSAS